MLSNDSLYKDDITRNEPKDIFHEPFDAANVNGTNAVSLPPYTDQDIPNQSSFSALHISDQFTDHTMSNQHIYDTDNITERQIGSRFALEQATSLDFISERTASIHSFNEDSMSLPSSHHSLNGDSDSLYSTDSTDYQQSTQQHIYNQDSASERSSNMYSTSEWSNDIR